MRKATIFTGRILENKVTSSHLLAGVLFLFMAIFTIRSFVHGDSLFLLRDVIGFDPFGAMYNATNVFSLEATRRILYLGPYLFATTSLGLTVLVIQKLNFVLIHFLIGFLAYLSSYKFLSSKGYNRNELITFIVSALFGFFYLYNARVGQGLSISNWGYAFSYALIPIIFYYFDKSLNEPRFRNIFIVSMLISLAIAATAQFLVLIPAFIILPCLLFVSLKKMKAGASILPAVRGTLLVATLTAGISFYWIYISIMTMNSGIVLQPDYVLTKQMLDTFSSPASLENVIRMMANWWPYLDLTPIFHPPTWVLLTFFVPIAFAASILFTRDSKTKEYMVFFSLVSLAIIFLAKGTQPPLSELYINLYDIPVVGWMFRLPSAISVFLPFYVGMVIILGLSKLLAFTSGRIVRCLKIVCPAILILSIITTSWPLFTGDFGGAYNNDQQPNEIGSADTMQFDISSANILVLGSNADHVKTLLPENSNGAALIIGDHHFNLEQPSRVIPDKVVLDEKEKLPLRFLNKDAIILKPFDLTRNHDPSKVWSVAATNDPLHGPFHGYLDHFGVKNNDTDYGYGLVLTWDNDELELPFSIENRGTYHIFIRYLENNAGGALRLTSEDKSFDLFTKGQTDSFVWADLGSVILPSGQQSVHLENIFGLNAVNVMILVSEESLMHSNDLAEKFAHENRLIYILDKDSFSGGGVVISEDFLPSNVGTTNSIVSSDFRTPRGTNYISLQFMATLPDDTLGYYTIEDLSIAPVDDQPILRSDFEGQPDYQEQWQSNSLQFMSVSREDRNPIEGDGSLKIDISRGTSPYWHVISSEKLNVSGKSDIRYKFAISASNTDSPHAKVIFYDVNYHVIDSDTIFRSPGDNYSQEVEKILRTPLSTEYISLQFWAKPKPDHTSNFVVDNILIEGLHAPFLFNDRFDLFRNSNPESQQMMVSAERLEVNLDDGSSAGASIIQTEPIPVDGELNLRYSMNISSSNIVALNPRIVYHQETGQDSDTNIPTTDSNAIRLGQNSMIFSTLDIPKSTTYTIALRPEDCLKCGEITLNVGNDTVKFSPKDGDSRFGWYYFSVYLPKGQVSLDLHSEEEAVLDKIAIYSDMTEGTTMEQLFELNGSAATIVHQKRISPTHYELTINSTSPFMLISNNKYTGLWSAFGNEAEYKSVALEPSVDGFYVNELGLLTLSVQFLPQTWFIQGLIVTVGTLIGSVAYLVWQRMTSVSRFPEKTRNNVYMGSFTLNHEPARAPYSFKLGFRSEIIQMIREPETIAIWSAAILLIVTAILTAVDFIGAKEVMIYSFIFLLVGVLVQFVRIIIVPAYKARTTHSVLKSLPNTNAFQQVDKSESMISSQQRITKLHTILARFNKGRRLNVLLLGAYGSANVGDLAILDVMIEDLSQDNRITFTVPSRDVFLKENYRINLINPFSLRGVWKSLKQDVIVVGGGGIFGHETHLHMKLMMPFLFIAELLGKKIVFYDVGIFKAESKIMLRVLWAILRRADDIVLRDDTDVEIIPQDILARAQIEPDITFSLKAKEPKDQSIVHTLSQNDRVVGLSLRFVNLKDLRNENDERIAAAVKEVILEQFLKKDIRILFIPFQPIDREYVEHYFRDIIDQYPDKFIILETTKFSINEIKWIIGKLEFTVGMRLHFQIFSHDQDVPFVGIAYAPKNTNFLSKVGAPRVDAYKITTADLTRAVIDATTLLGKSSRNYLGN